MQLQYHIYLVNIYHLRRIDQILNILSYKLCHNPIKQHECGRSCGIHDNHMQFVPKSNATNTLKYSLW